MENKWLQIHSEWSVIKFEAMVRMDALLLINAERRLPGLPNATILLCAWLYVLCLAAGLALLILFVPSVFRAFMLIPTWLYDFFVGTMNDTFNVNTLLSSPASLHRCLSQFHNVQTAEALTNSLAPNSERVRVFSLLFRVLPETVFSRSASSVMALCECARPSNTVTCLNEISWRFLRTSFSYVYKSNTKTSVIAAATMWRNACAVESSWRMR